MALGLYQQQCGHRPRAVPIFLCWTLVTPHLESWGQFRDTLRWTFGDLSVSGEGNRAGQGAEAQGATREGLAWRKGGLRGILLLSPTL